MIAEISQPKLKWSSPEIIERFANRVILFIDPKFTDEDPDNPLSDINIALNKVKDYAKRSDLTESEFLIALEMAPKGFLTLDGEKVKFFREVNQANFAEYEAGYIEFKSRDAKFQNGKAEISKYLNPPPPEMTFDELQKTTIENIRKDYHRFKADGKVMATPIFYDLIVFARGGGKVKLEFVENFLKNYVPEVAEGKVGSNGTSLPKVIKKDVFVEFQNEMICNYVEYLKLHETSEDLWVQHWERLLNLKNSGNEKESNTNNIAG